MGVFGPGSARCEVLIFREGLLSAVAHDLVLRVERFEIRTDPRAPSIEASFDASSLRVVAAMRDGRPLPDALSPADVRKIEANAVGDVLHARRHPAIRFRSTAVVRRDDGALEVEGRLALHGQERPVSAVVRRAGDRLAAEVALHQPAFGIRPYVALLGAIRVRPDVVVRVSVPAGDGRPDEG